MNLDSPGEGRRQLAQVASALGQKIKPAIVATAIRETLTDSIRPANPCSACAGTGLDSAGPLACGGCAGYGTVAS